MSFPLVGNERLENSVLSTISSGRIPHAILIEGEVGLGKHTLASFISKAAVCERDKKPCGECKSCHMAMTNSHPDISVIGPLEGKKNITVSQIRELRADAFIKPHMAEHKVYIIDDADTMNEQSQNALLKILEEPPQGVIFILICKNKSTLLDTVISRSISFLPDLPEIGLAADYIVETGTADRTAAVEVLEKTDGNIGRALSLLNNEMGDAAYLLAEEFLKYALSGEKWQMLTLTAKMENDRILAEQFFKQLKIVTANTLKKNYHRYNAAQISDFYNLLSGFEESLKTNINLPLLFTALVAKSVELI